MSLKNVTYVDISDVTGAAFFMSSQMNSSPLSRYTFQPGVWEASTVEVWARTNCNCSLSLASSPTPPALQLTLFRRAWRCLRRRVQAS
jgi:hypothetical protein